MNKFGSCQTGVRPPSYVAKWTWFRYLPVHLWAKTDCIYLGIASCTSLKVHVFVACAEALKMAHFGLLDLKRNCFILFRLFLSPTECMTNTLMLFHINQIRLTFLEHYNHLALSSRCCTLSVFRSNLSPEQFKHGRIPHEQGSALS